MNEIVWGLAILGGLLAGGLLLLAVFCLAFVSLPPMDGGDD